MTNREAFNQWFREEIEEQIKYMEKMTDEELVKYTISTPGYHVEKNIGNAISYFKATHAPMPVGPADKVIKWFGEEWKE